MLKHFIKTVPFSSIRHNDLSCYVEEGYGGKAIECWPVYDFYCDYLKGNKKTAHEAFRLWYHDQLKKYHNVSKDLGGMYRGTLYVLIEKRSGTHFKSAGPETVDAAICERVTQRFALLESIQRDGYDPTIERVDGVHKHGQVYLTGGHHRAAALRALGEERFPGILVFPHQIIYNSFTVIRRIKDHAKIRKQRRV